MFRGALCFPNLPPFLRLHMEENTVYIWQLSIKEQTHIQLWREFFFIFWDPDELYSSQWGGDGLNLVVTLTVCTSCRTAQLLKLTEHLALWPCSCHIYTQEISGPVHPDQTPLPARPHLQPPDLSLWLQCWTTSSKQTLMKTSACLSFVRMIYFPSSTSEVWDWVSSAFLKRTKYVLLGGKKERGGRKGGEANENKEGEGWEQMCKKRSMGLVKRIKWVGMKYKYKQSV